MTQMNQLPRYSVHDVKRKMTKMLDFALIVALNLTFSVISEVSARQTS